jgi:hypothetical protein
VVESIVAAKAAGKTDTDAAKAAGISTWTLYKWLRERPDFRRLYNHALEVLDSTRIASSKLARDRLEAQLASLRADFRAPAAA